MAGCARVFGGLWRYMCGTYDGVWRGLMGCAGSCGVWRSVAVCSMCVGVVWWSEWQVCGGICGEGAVGVTGCVMRCSGVCVRVWRGVMECVSGCGGV